MLTLTYNILKIKNNPFLSITRSKRKATKDKSYRSQLQYVNLYNRLQIEVSINNKSSIFVKQFYKIFFLIFGGYSVSGISVYISLRHVGAGF